MTIRVGDTVRLVRRKIRTGGGTKPTECQIWETIEVPLEEQKVGLVIKDANNGAFQVTVLCDGEEKYWFMKNVKKVNEGG